MVLGLMSFARDSCVRSAGTTVREKLMGMETAKQPLRALEAYCMCYHSSVIPQPSGTGC